MERTFNIIDDVFTGPFLCLFFRVSFFSFFFSSFPPKDWDKLSQVLFYFCLFVRLSLLQCLVGALKHMYILSRCLSLSVSLSLSLSLCLSLSVFTCQVMGPYVQRYIWSEDCLYYSVHMEWKLSLLQCTYGVKTVFTTVYIWSEDCLYYSAKSWDHMYKDTYGKNWNMIDAHMGRCASRWSWERERERRERERESARESFMRNILDAHMGQGASRWSCWWI